MDAFAVRAAASIHAEAPEWLIFVEGTAHSPNCSRTIDGAAVSCGYGDNLLGVAAHPVVLPIEGKLVYSVHTYGPSQHDRPEFHNANFPHNMRDVCTPPLVRSDPARSRLRISRVEHAHTHSRAARLAAGGDHWGYAISTGAAPTIVLGEWGGPTTGANGKWMGALVQYLQDKGIESNFFWALNQDGSPEGIITDWTATPPAVDAGKLAVLAKLTPKPTRFDPSCYIAAAPESR